VIPVPVNVTFDVVPPDKVPDVEEIDAVFKVSVFAPIENAPLVRVSDEVIVSELFRADPYESFNVKLAIEPPPDIICWTVPPVKTTAVPLIVPAKLKFPFTFKTLVESVKIVPDATVRLPAIVLLLVND